MACYAYHYCLSEEWFSYLNGSSAVASTLVTTLLALAPVGLNRHMVVRESSS